MWISPTSQEFLKPEELFTKNYAYFSSTSSSWCEHAKSFVEKAIKKLNLNKNSNVIEIASNDGYLLQYIKKKIFLALVLSQLKLQL